jgi:hypothetical protein
MCFNVYVQWRFNFKYSDESLKLSLRFIFKI